MATTGDGKVILSLMLVSSLYVIFLTTPSAMWTYWAGPLKNGNRDPKYSEFIFYVAYMLNQVSVMNYCCCNFIIYGCTLPFYRQEVKNVFLGLFKRRMRKGRRSGA
jgi:hypothetical protein